MGLRKPVTEKWVTVSGVLPEALTLKVPIGVSLMEVLRSLDAPPEGMGFILNGPHDGVGH